MLEMPEREFSEREWRPVFMRLIAHIGQSHVMLTTHVQRPDIHTIDLDLLNECGDFAN